VTNPLLLLLVEESLVREILELDTAVARSWPKEYDQDYVLTGDKCFVSNALCMALSGEFRPHRKADHTRYLIRCEVDRNVG
jgi:hypothetical protein